MGNEKKYIFNGIAHTEDISKYGKPINNNAFGLSPIVHKPIKITHEISEKDFQKYKQFAFDNYVDETLFNILLERSYLAEWFIEFD